MISVRSEQERDGGQDAQRGGETIDILYARPIEGRRDERGARGQGW